MSSATIHAQTLDGTWERVGTGRSLGIVAEGIQLTANEWGSDTASFTLKRDPGAVYPDLLPFTPIYVTVHGIKVWSGRVEDTPTRDGSERSISVQAKGWQYHLDDDIFWPFLGHTRLQDWTDIRSYIEADLTRFTTQYSVEAGDGAVTITAGGGVALANGADGAVYFDAGPGATIKRVVIEWESSNNDAYIGAYLFAADSPAFTWGSAEVSIVNMAGGASGTLSRTLTTARRYIAIAIQNSYTHTPGADVYLKLKSIKLFTSTAYESAGASTLTADDLATVALTATPNLLSTDTTGIEAQTFAIPDYAPAAYVTRRKVLEAVKQMEDAVVKVDVDKRLILKDKPQRPRFRVGRWSGSNFADNSAGSAGEIYNRVLVTGTGPDGQNMVVERAAGQVETFPATLLATPYADNPSFDTDVSGWTVVNGTFVRDTTDNAFTRAFDTAPAGGKLTASGNTYLEATFTGTFDPRTTYLLTFRYMYGVHATVEFGLIGSDSAKTELGNLSYGGKKTLAGHCAIAWNPAIATTGVKLRITPPASYAAFEYVDTLLLYKVTPTIPDRRGFRRTAELPVNSGLITELGDQLGDGWLSNHMATPFKGTLDVYRGGIREVIAGRNVHPSELLINTSEQLLLSQLVDPDTGAVGRSGRVVGVTYDHDDEHAQASIDNESGRFDAVLERLALVNG